MNLELRIYKSTERAVDLPIRLLTEISYKKGYSWQCEIPVDVDTRKGGVSVKVFLFPDIIVEEKSMATVLITAAIHQSVLKKLQEGKEDCWVMVETEALDKRTGHRLDFMVCSPHKINMINGKVNFYQNLLCCSDVLNCEGDVHLILKATFITSPKQRDCDDHAVVGTK